jgi:succinate dehydrogenase flavin-adding protein (antitoxin of CptAB toxin-antitoxin module)
MRELDMLLLRFLERDFAVAEPAERRAFAALLSWQDPDILALLTGQLVVDDPALRHVVQRLLTHH